MARKYVLVDDLDNKESTEDNPVETVAFSYEGKLYTIDLSAKNKTALDKALSKFIDSAAEDMSMKIVPREIAEPKRKARTSGRSAPVPSQSDETPVIREWAVSRGLMEPGKRGRIPSEIRQQYRQETGQIISPAPVSPPASDPEPVSQAG